MEHLNKLNKSINSKRLPYSGDVVCTEPVVCIQRRRDAVRLRHNANYFIHAQIPGSEWAEHGDLFTLQIIPGREPSIRAEPTSSRWAYDI